MRKKLLILGLLCIPLINYAQFNVGGVPLDRYGRTNATPGQNIKAIGIGNFATFPRAALHVNANLLTAPTNPGTMFIPGQVFRTDGPINRFNRWQLFTGPDANATEKFQIFTSTNLTTANGTLQNDQNITLQATQRDMIFNAGGDGLNFERMRILGQDHNLSTNTPWFAVARAGNVGIGTPHPLCMLQIGGEAASGAGWRNWMDIGTYYASREGFDNMYVGLDSVDTDQYDAIINWGNNPANTPNGDRLRFIFTASPGNGTASGQTGLEVGRFVSDGNVSRFGVGDFFTLNDNPKRQMDVFDDGMTGTNPPAIGRPQFRITQTLSNNITQGVFTDFHCTGSNNTYNPNSSGTDGHLLINPRSKGTPRTVAINFEDGGTPIFGGLSLDVNGQQNIRTVNNDDNLTHVLVWDPNNEGRVMWRDVATIGGTGLDFDWEHIVGTGVFSGHNNIGGFNDQPVYVGFTPAMLIPQNIPLPSRFAAWTDIGGVGLNNMEGSITGFFLNEYSLPVLESRAAAVVGMARGNRCGIKQTINYGGFFWADEAETNIGGFFQARCCGSPYGGPTYGIWATADHNCQNAWAGYFDGNVTVMGTFSNPSDIAIKENIAPITSILDDLTQLNPVQFDYRTSQFPQLGLPTGNQFGFIAQDVELIFPDLVYTHTTPKMYDMEGNLIRDSITLKEIDYVRIVPLAIQGIKELKDENDSLKAIIASYEDRLTSIENILSSCCSQSKSASVEVVIQTKPVVVPSNNNQLGQNYPNPFKTVTTFTYTIADDGFVEFVIEDSFGKKIVTTVSQNQTKGSYSFDWEPTNLSPGIYFYSLRVNGEILVKKAIKIE
jgi:hypothetical protein